MTLEELYGINMQWDADTVLRVREASEPDIVWLMQHNENLVGDNFWDYRVMWFDGNDVLVTKENKEK